MGTEKPAGMEQSCRITIALSDGKRSARSRSRSTSKPGLSIELTINRLGLTCPNLVTKPEIPIYGEALEKMAPTFAEPSARYDSASVISKHADDAISCVHAERSQSPANSSTRLRSSPRFNLSVRPVLLNDATAGSCKSAAVSHANRFSA